MKILTLIYIEILAIFFSEFLLAFIYLYFAKFEFKKFFVGMCFRLLNLVITIIIGGAEKVSLMAVFLVFQTTLTGIYIPKIRKKMEKFKIEEKEDEQNN